MIYPLPKISLIILRLALFSASLLMIASCGIVRETTVIPSEKGAVLGNGIASWYGPDFHGKPTANGEIYDMNDLTAAHRTLPFNTVVLVENIDNGRTVVVRINDRGPYVGNRIIDLSRQAAREIDMIQTGIANVEIYLIEEGDRPITSQNISNRESYTIQIASFEREQEAINHANTISGTRVERVGSGNSVVFRVYYGVYNTREAAVRAQRDLSARGINGFVKQAEN